MTSWSLTPPPNEGVEEPTCQQLGVLLVDHVGEVSSVVQDHVEGLAVFEVQRLLDAPHVLLVGHSLPRVHCTTDATLILL